MINNSESRCAVVRFCHSHYCWGWASHFWYDASKKHLQLTFRLLLQIKCRLSDKLRRLLCLLRKWHAPMSPPTQTKSCWLKKLWILCNRIIIGYIYVYYALVLLQAVSALWLVMNAPLFKDQRNKSKQRRKRKEKKQLDFCHLFEKFSWKWKSKC